MADGDSGASGVLGVLVGVMLVILIGAAFVMARGDGGGASAPGFTIKLPGTR